MAIILNIEDFSSKEMKIDSIYIIHYKENLDRKKYLDEHLKTFNIPFEFRSLFDRDSQDILSDMYFDISLENCNKRNHILREYNKLIEIGPDKDTLKGRAYRAVTLEHFKTYEHILNKTDFNNVLILEDDVRFCDNFTALLNDFLQALPDNYDVCYIGSGCNLQLPDSTDKILDKHPYYYSKCSDSYIISRKALEKIVKTALPFFGAIDWELNYLQALNKLNVYWTTIPAVHQGSQHGYYGSCFHILE
jgi:GR25 family glycosyltransferase involved in LPS biosynthesis